MVRRCWVDFWLQVPGTSFVHCCSTISTCSAATLARIDNRTAFDLVFRDLDVPPMFENLPFLCKLQIACQFSIWVIRSACSVQTPCSASHAVYHPVKAPGYQSSGQGPVAPGPQAATQQGTHAGAPDLTARGRWQLATQQVTRALNVPQPALLNEQARTAFKWVVMV